MKEQNIVICSYDVLPDGTIKPSALQRYFQQIALEDIASQGATYNALRELSMVFVITKLRIDFLQTLRSGDSIVLRTFPYKTEGVTFFRAFEIYKNGSLAVLADSRWVLINYQKRTILRPSDLPFPLAQSVPSAELPPIPRRIIQKTAEHTATRTVCLTEVDENKHLNNCVYADYILDHAPIDICNHKIKAMCILFEHEAYLGDLLEIRYEKTDDGFSAVAYDQTTAKPCFQAAIALDF